jgi:hypothetical protein
MFLQLQKRTEEKLFNWLYHLSFRIHLPLWKLVHKPVNDCNHFAASKVEPEQSVYLKYSENSYLDHIGSNLWQQVHCRDFFSVIRGLSPEFWSAGILECCNVFDTRTSKICESCPVLVLSHFKKVDSKSEVACIFQQNKTYLESDVKAFQIEENYVLV